VLPPTRIEWCVTTGFSSPADASSFFSSGLAASAAFFASAGTDLVEVFSSAFVSVFCWANALVPIASASTTMRVFIRSPTMEVGLAMVEAWSIAVNAIEFCPVHGKPNYGIDAPGVIRNLLLIGLALLAVSYYIGGWGKFGPRFRPTFLITGSVLVVEGLAM